jgi:hypothetical protein
MPSTTPTAPIHFVRRLGLHHFAYLRAVARRHAGIGEWRLVGLHIGLGTSVAVPTLEDFCEQQGLDGWSEAEILEMYADAYPANHRHGIITLKNPDNILTTPRDIIANPKKLQFKELDGVLLPRVLADVDLAPTMPCKPISNLAAMHC